MIEQDIVVSNQIHTRYATPKRQRESESESERERESGPRRSLRDRSNGICCTDEYNAHKRVVCQPNRKEIPTTITTTQARQVPSDDAGGIEKVG
jgi:hypothetical protein